MIRMEKTDLLNFVKSALKGNISPVEIIVRYENDDMSYQYEYIFYEDYYEILVRDDDNGIWDELTTVELDEKTIEELTYPQLVTKLTRLSDLAELGSYVIYIIHEPMFNMEKFEVVQNQFD